MWRNEFAATIKRLQSKLAAAKSQLQDQNAEENVLNLSLVILNKLITRIHDLKSDILSKRRTKSSHEDDDTESGSIAELLLDAEEIVSELELRLKQNSGSVLLPPSNITENTQSSNYNNGIQRPKITIPEFSGEVTEFTGFWELFTTAFDHSSITVIEKFSYLKSYLRGEAKRLIEGIPLTTANYTVVVNLLKEKYGDKKQIIQRLYVQLTNLSKANTSTNSLRTAYDTMEAILRHLEQLGEEVNNNAILFGILIAKFPQDIFISYSATKSVDTVENIRAAVRTTVQLREKFSGNSTITSSSPTFLTSSASASPKGKNPYCVYCQESHWSDTCKKYKTMEERKSVIQGKCCFICLRQGHNLRQCKKQTVCAYCKKAKNHHRSLCPVKFSEKKSADNSSTTDNGSTPTTNTKASTSVMLITGKEHASLLTALVTVSNGDIRKTARVLLDSASERTYISNKMSRMLNLQPVLEEALNITVFATKKANVVNTALFEFDFALADGTKMTVMANSINEIAKLPKTSSQLSTNLPKPIIPDDDRDIDILIGADYFFDFLLPEKIELQNHLYLISTKLGYLLCGRDRTNTVDSTFTFHSYAQPISVTDLWDLDSLGIKEDPFSNLDEEKALDDFYKTISYDGATYSVGWPWKYFPPDDLPTNFPLAYHRLKSLLKHLSPELFNNYDKVIQQQLTSGVIEEVNDSKNTLTHYLPHKAVITPEKSTTLRVVHDASSKARKTDKSLNDCIFKGKTLLEDLCALLLRFQTHPVGLCADIEKAFLQLTLLERDRDFVRFLWLRDPTTRTIENNLQIYRFCKVPFGVIASPFLLSATVQFHLNKFQGPIVENLKMNFYADNFVSGVNSVQEAITTYHESRRIFQNASMNLRAWATNKPEVVQQTGNFDWIPGEKIKLLGLWWRTGEDTLHTSFNTTPLNIVTKRGILKFVASIFDPLGWFSPIILPAKLLIQSLWQKKYDWDDILDADETTKWENIFAELIKINNQHIPRITFTEKAVSLHCFVDASTLAYATVIYAVSDNSQTPTLLFSKTRVAPPKSITVPKLELLAAVIGVRATKFVRDSLRPCCTISSIFIWSDSKCVLSWIKTSKVLPTFVRRRIQEIKTHNFQFQYVPSADNPADIASRGASFDIVQASLWKNGPQWLKNGDWPTQTNLEEIPTEDAPTVAASFIINTEKVESPFQLEEKRFSKLSTLIGTTVKCFEALNKFRKKPNLYDINRATIMNMWIKYVQKSHIQNTLPSTAFEKNEKKGLLSLGLWTDNDGIIRCSGRLTLATITEEEKFPVLLPSKAYFTTLVIMDTHCHLKHAGVSHTLAELRATFWIPRGRATIFNTIKKYCALCKIFASYPYKAPQFPPLPEFRVRPTRPFQFTGLDIFGPLITRLPQTNEKKKAWALLLTCMSTRAIHIEILYSLNSYDILLALRKFIARRGSPQQLLSDNALQFKLLASNLSNITQDFDENPELTSYFALQQIQWKFIPEFSPWMGGAYERIIGIIKTSLKKAVFKTTLTIRHLETILIEIEAIINSRPIIHVGEEFPAITLSPSKLINVQYNGAPEITANFSTRNELLQIWAKGNDYLNEFWEIWKKHYLLALREKQRVQTLKQYRTAKIIPKIGAVVLIEDAHHPRGMWKLGIIISLNASADGEVRSAVLRLKNGKNITRPIVKLFPLELDVFEETIDALPETLEFDEIDEIEVEEIYED